MLSLIFLLILPIFLLFLLKKEKNPNLPPGPKGFPFIGNVFQLDNSNISKHLWLLSQKYGPLMYLKLGLKPTLIVSSAKMAEEVLKTQDLEFCSRPSLTGPQKMSYNGIDLAFAPYDTYYRNMRKICVVHLLNWNRVQKFCSIREDEVFHMLQKISQSAVDSKSVNLTETMVSLTGSIIYRIAFGKRYEDGGSEGTRFHELIQETQAMLGSFYFSDYFSYVGWLVDKFTGLLARLEKCFNGFDVFYQELIDEHLDPNRDVPSHENILDVLLEMWKDGSSSKVQLTLDHIKAILMNVLVAGTDTGTAAVIWAMSFLMKNPTTMEKAQEEIRNYIGEKGFVNEDDIQNLPYLKAVVKETMRLQPTVPLLVPRETTENRHIGGYEIPAKTLVYVNAWAIGRDPKVWENPLEFNPDRFLKSSIDMKGQDYELIPFGAGRRICPGMYMGIANVELSLANLVYKFGWEMPHGMKRDEIDTDSVLPGIVVQTKSDLVLVPKIYI